MSGTRAGSTAFKENNYGGFVLELDLNVVTACVEKLSKRVREQLARTIVTP